MRLLDREPLREESGGCHPNGLFTTLMGQDDLFGGVRELSTPLVQRDGIDRAEPVAREVRGAQPLAALRGTDIESSTILRGTFICWA